MSGLLEKAEKRLKKEGFEKVELDVGNNRISFNSIIGDILLKDSSGRYVLSNWAGYSSDSLFFGQYIECLDDLINILPHLGTTKGNGLKYKHIDREFSKYEVYEVHKAGHRKLVGLYIEESREEAIRRCINDEFKKEIEAERLIINSLFNRAEFPSSFELQKIINELYNIRQKMTTDISYVAVKIN